MSKIIKMDRKAIERIISLERLEPYIKHHSDNFDIAIEHYKANIEISEAFYPLLAILEIGLRNNFDYRLARHCRPFYESCNANNKR